MKWRDWVKVALLTPIVFVGLVVVFAAFVITAVLVWFNPWLAFLIPSAYIAYLRVKDGEWMWE